MIVPAARPFSREHWITALAPYWEPASWQLLWPCTLAGILLSSTSKSDVGLASGDPDGLVLGLVLGLVPGLVLDPVPGDWDELAATVWAGNGLRCAAAATPR